jgi:MBG domain (YGX type)
MNKYLSFFRSGLAIIIISILVVIPVSNALAASAGPYDPALGTNLDRPGGTEPWTDPGNIAGPGYAIVDLYHLHQYSEYLQGTHYGFGIPADATIVGIEVRVNRLAVGPPPSIYDTEVSLVIDDVVLGDNKASALPWPTSFAIATYGSPTDLWGTSWTPAQVNSDGFGVVLAANRGNQGQSDKYATVDSMQITVYFDYSTTTGVVCGGTVAYGDITTCVASITRLGSDLTPTGTVSWTTDGSGTFKPNPCNLAGTGGTASCSAGYTPTVVGSGAHSITGSYSGDVFFEPSSAAELITVTQRTITVSADALVKVYGEPDPELTYQITQGSLVFSDTFTGTLTRAPGEDVGTYPILQGTFALNDNYDLTYVGADLTIEPIAITVSADPITKVYGQSDPQLTYTVTSGTLLPGDVFTGTLTRQLGENAGVYAIEQGSLALPGYYALTFVAADFTVTKADPTCVVEPYAVVYDRELHTATGSCTGVHSELLAGLDLTATTHSIPGDYTDPWSFTDGTGNYNIASGTVNDVIQGMVYWWPLLFR